MNGSVPGTVNVPAVLARCLISWLGKRSDFFRIVVVPTVGRRRRHCHDKYIAKDHH